MWKKCATFSLAVLLVSCSLWAFPGRVTVSQEVSPTDTSEVAALLDELKNDSGMTLEKNSTEQSQNSSDTSLLVADLMGVKENLDALEEASLGKDQVIDSLAEENASLAKDAEEAGSKVYLMLDGLVRFDSGLPDYGVGLTIGTRLGNSLMLEAGADYMINKDLSFGLDNWTFRAGLGWMF